MLAKYQTNKRKQNRCCIIYTHTHTHKFLVLESRLCVFFIEFPGMAFSTIHTTTPSPHHMETNLPGLRHILTHTHTLAQSPYGGSFAQISISRVSNKIQFFCVFVFFFFILISFICALFLFSFGSRL